MNHPVIQSALARERRQLMLSQAQSDRQARQIRSQRRQASAAGGRTSLPAAAGHRPDQLARGFLGTAWLSRRVRNLFLSPLP